MNTSIMSDLLIGEQVLDQIETKKIETHNTHGTGCTMASALAAGLAKSFEIKKAFQNAHYYVNQAIITSPGFGKGHGPINHLSSINIDSKFSGLLLLVNSLLGNSVGILYFRCIRIGQDHNL